MEQKAMEHPQTYGHPLIGFGVTIVSFVSGLILQVQADLFPVFGELLRDGAWFMAMCAGAFTCYGVIKTHHGKKKGKR